MSRKNYIAFARMLSTYKKSLSYQHPETAYQCMVLAFAEYLQQDNPRFNWQRFVTACAAGRE